MLDAMRIARVHAPAAFALVNAVAFYLLRPGVPDLWAARARASAVGHGVGLTYWFSWFGGSTPGNYSVVTPYLCAKLGTEFVGAAAAVVLSAAGTALVRNTARPRAAAWMVAFGVVVNLWCGRVPFLLGSALAAGALLCVQRRRKIGAAVLSVLSVLASPVAGAFLCIGLSGVLLTARMRRYRATALLAVLSAAGAMIMLAVVFGIPGPEPLPPYLIGEIALALALMLVSSPPDHLRSTLLVAGLAAVALFLVPNGMGANLARLALFCLPPAVVASSRRPARAVAMLAAPILVLSALSSVSALVSAAKPSASAAYYAPLADELDTVHAALGYRVELVSAGHAAYAALLDHALLARGWETQEDLALNARLASRSLDLHGYRAWLDDNAVGYVALNLPGDATPEARLITTARPSYLRAIWRSAHWQLFEVAHPRPIVATPAALTASTQSALTVHIPCTCRVSLRVRWSKFLSVDARLPDDTSDSIEDTYQPTLVRDGTGWSTLTTNRAGTYVVAGSL
jgi:hypothetical protein